ncbi:MAG: UDP-N-acetylglucosamine--N-acetylmuramyl-(pentapeptide) pyrophosphoryl-undecaprenol N-acetylglucosamine transferase, partial [Planctomycetaceae bacterium]|nr:UDP-N-acetylglucosamine--N-acetylmuramyl-(pentapeptide) pyrophosphoryl-undecaprenol N-acetylglucosamine transferase [Planctomycetaceae bacterium]
MASKATQEKADHQRTDDIVSLCSVNDSAMNPLHWNCVAFAGGGSGGHLNPAIALAHEILKHSPDCQLVFLTSQREIDQRLLQAAGLPTANLTIIALPAPTGRRLLTSPVTSSVQLYRSVRTAGRILQQVSAQCVFGLGGFASVSGVLAARRKKIPIVLLEPNVQPGRATNWLARTASAICSGLPLTPRFQQRWGKKITQTGIPLRPPTPARSLTATSTQNAPLSAMEPDSLRLVIVGGSQGSASVNQLMQQALQSIMATARHWRILHLTGTSHHEQLQAWYAAHRLNAEVASYRADLPELFQSADVVVSRAGAATIAELAHASTAAILIPLRHAADDHQQRNAELLHDHAAALVVDELANTAIAQLHQHLLRLASDIGLRQN